MNYLKLISAATDLAERYPSLHGFIADLLVTGMQMVSDGLVTEEEVIDSLVGTVEAEYTRTAKFTVETSQGFVSIVRYDYDGKGILEVAYGSDAYQFPASRLDMVKEYFAYWSMTIITEVR